MKIVKSYKGLKLYEGKKANKGFHVEILASLHNLLVFALQTMKNPKTVHFVISKPTRLKRLSKYLERWRIRRIKFNRELSSVKYFGSTEVRPRNKEEHLHLCIVADSINYDDMCDLKEMLQSFSSINRCKLEYRDRSYLPLDLDPNTGEIQIDTYTNSPKRKGKTWCHKLRLEFDDALQRLSYICKIQTKVELNYICSRLLKSKQTRQSESSTIQSTPTVRLQPTNENPSQPNEFSDAPEAAKIF